MKRGNLELRKIASGWEIICWEDCPYFGKQADYDLVDGWYRPKGNTHHSIDPKLFDKKQTCYTICFIKLGIPDYVENRPMELVDSDLRPFLFLLRAGIKKSQIKTKN